MITLEATYSKKLGLPNFSSHCYVVSLSTELTDLSQVEDESARLYALLQATVDKELQQVGYAPEGNTPSRSGNGQGHPARNGSNGTGHVTRTARPPVNKPTREQESEEPWACSDKQQALILRIVSENNLNKDEVEQMSYDLFGVGVKACDKMQASQLIEDLLEKTGTKVNRRSRWRQPARS